MNQFDSKHVTKSVLLIAAIGSLLALTVLSFYFFWFQGELSDKQDVWGSFGDFVGGTLNPLFSFLALIALLLTIVLQTRQLEMSSKELALSRQELALTRNEVSRSADALASQDRNLLLQRFETTFCNLLKHIEACRKEISYGSSDKLVNGGDAIEKLYENFQSSLTEVTGRRGHFPTYSFKQSCHEINGIKAEYKKFYESQHGDDLGQYFRLLYHILRFVDENHQVESKSFYTNLLRAQLSRYELCLIFYNSISQFGEEKMAPLIKKYNILKHMEKSKIKEQNHHILEDFLNNVP